MHGFLLAFGLASIASHVSASLRPIKRSYDSHTYYVLEHIPLSGVPAQGIADALGAELVEPAGELQDHWLLRTNKEFDVVQERLDNIRNGLHPRSAQDNALALSIRGLEMQVPRQRVKRELAPPPTPPGTDKEEFSSARSVANRFNIEDPLFTEQWHIVNELYPEHMVNASAVWEMGITGKGVISALVDDGLEYESEDIADNFDAAGSHDFNMHTELPKPLLFDDHHGTRCAGQIAAVRNGACGVGIAYDSKVAGIRILSAPISDVDEAAALNFGYQNTAIYSCSWGPADDGASMEGPAYLIEKAVLNGVQKGRDGKGSVFVFASGNGGFMGDQCNFDGYTNSIYSVTVAAIDYAGKHPSYSEACAANMVVTYSSGTNHNKAIVTTNIGKNDCTHMHGGTSAAAPNAAGIFALALSARPDLTWRDIQHLCMLTGKVVNPDDDWETTATGRPFSYRYGYGKLDAYDFVMAAKEWNLVTPQAWVQMPAVQLADGTSDKYGHLKGGEPIVGTLSSTTMITAEDLASNNFDKVEHVTVHVWIAHLIRGHVAVELVSPAGIVSRLAWKRPHDRAGSGFVGWRFMTVKHWGEDPIGTWTIRVSDQGEKGANGTFIGWSLSLWGSSVDPSKTAPYILPLSEQKHVFPPEPVLPPPEEHMSTSAEASTTKSHPKPTIIPMMSTSSTMSIQPTTSSSSTALQPTHSSTTMAPPQPTPSAVSDIDVPPARLLGWSASTWAYIAVGAIALSGVIVSTLYIWRRFNARRRDYSLVSGEEVGMDAVESGDRVALLNSHGDAMEEVDHRAPTPDHLRFHSGFLDDEETPNPYRDNEEGQV